MHKMHKNVFHRDLFSQKSFEGRFPVADLRDHKLMTRNTKSLVSKASQWEKSPKYQSEGVRF